ncbi:unnamed protein product [marine sediment metagenome]|uniref:Uncharacterized protein n=1 Tax=marine sediment metagenome TaxID=412755 RepID=X1UK31_9ZZZZ
MGLCDMCGRRIKGHLLPSSTVICRSCFGELQIVIAKLRAEGRAVEGLRIAREGFNETYTGGDYLIRDIPEELVNKALMRADKDGDSLRDVTVKAMQAYLTEKGGE